MGQRFKALEVEGGPYDFTNHIQKIVDGGYTLISSGKDQGRWWAVFEIMDSEGY